MRLVLRRVLFASVAVIFCATTASAQHHGHHGGGGWGHHGGGGRWGSNWGWGGGWGGSFYGGGLYGFGRAGGFLPYTSYGYGYSGFGGFGLGGLNYYNGPVAGYYPYGYTSFGYPNFGYGLLAPSPVVIPTQPLFLGPNLADNPVIQEWMPKGQGGNANAAPFQPRQTNVPIVVKPTTPEAKRKSIRYQAQGDEWFAKQNYLQAYARYKQAYAAAADRPEPRYRMAIALAAATEFDQAVDELKRLAQVAPDWPVNGGERLDELFGADRGISKNAMLHKVANWVREDIRDPNRLYLLGVLLHFNEDADKAKTLLETAGLLAGNPQHVRVFLDPAMQRPAQARAGDAPRPRDLRIEEEEDEAVVPQPQARRGAPPNPPPANPPQPNPPEPARKPAGPRSVPPEEPLPAGRDGR